MRYIFLFFFMFAILGILILIDSEFSYEYNQGLKKITAQSSDQANRFNWIYQID